MPIGITRAADRNAIWLEAADDDGINSDDYLQQKYVTKPDELTGEDYLNADYTPIQPEDVAVTPDGGMVPDGAGTITGPPPVPAAPVAPAVVIPNTNKFKPVNGLKKLLDSIPDDAEPGIGPHGMNLTNWLAGHQPFVHTYLKPNYADAVKASVGGDKAYAKLLKHAPTQVSTALTTHTQHPAPNSNKFKTPANGLKKLLDNPNTTPEHVQAWIDKHPAFAKGYLHNPSYQDAVKGWIGEDNYHGWQEHLQVPAAPKPDKAKAIADQAAEAFAPAGFVPKTQEQFFHDHVPEGSGPQAPLPPTPGAASPGEIAPEDQPDIDAIKQMQPADQFQMPPDDQFTDAGPLLDDALGPKPSVGAQIKALIPDKTNVTAESLDFKLQTKTPEAIKKLFDKTIEQNPSLGPKLQKIYDDNFGQPSQPLAPEDQTEADAIKQQMAPTGLQPGELSVVPPSVPPEDQAEVDGIKQQALAEGIKAIFPSVDPSVATMPVEKQKQLLESWKTHLVHTPGHNDNLTKVTKLYDQYFGQQPAAGGYDGLSGEMKPVSVQDASDAIGGNPWNEEEEEGPPPGFQQWYTEQIDNTPGAWENEPPEMKTNLVKQYQGDLDYANPPLAPEDQAEAEAIKAQMPIDYAEPVNVDNPAEAAAGPDKYTKSFDKWLQNKGYPPASQLFEEVESLDDFYDLKAQYKDEYEAGQATAPAALTPGQKKKQLLKDLMVEMPTPPGTPGAKWTYAIIGTNPLAVQTQLKALIDYGADPDGKIKAVYRKHFGDTPLPPTGPPPGKLTSAIFKKYFPDGGYLDWAKGGNVEAQKAAIKDHIDGLKKEKASLWGAAKWQAIYDEAFGPDLTGFNQDFKTIMPGLDMSSLSPAEQQQHLQKLIDSNAGSPTGKALKALHDKYFSGQSVAPGGGPVFNADQYIADLSTASGFTPEEYASSWKDPKTAPHELADYLDYLKKFDSNSALLPQYQAIYDKWFGGPAAQPPASTSKPPWWVGDWSPALQHSIEFSDFKEFVNGKGYDTEPANLDDDVWAVLAQEYNHLLGIAPGGDYYVEPSTTSDPNKPSLAWVQEHWGPGYFKDQAELDQWYSNWAKNPAANDAPGVLKKWLNDDYGDKDQYQQGAPSDSPFSADSMPGPLDNPFGTGSMGVAYDHDPKFQQWWQSQSPDFQTEYIAKPLSAYQQYSKDMETAGTPIPKIDNWSQNPWAQGSEEEEEQATPALLVYDTGDQNDNLINGLEQQYDLSVKMYNTLHTKPGMLQTFLALTDDEKSALTSSIQLQNQWVNDHKDDPYVPAGQTPTFDSTALTSEVGKALGLKMPPGTDAWAEQWKSPETAGPILQKVIQDSKSDPTQQAALQAIYNKYFGDAAGFAAAPKTFPPFSHLDPWNNTLSTMFKQWFSADNSAFDLDDPGSADQVKMLKDTTNNWTKQKLQGFKKFTDWLQAQGGFKIGNWDEMVPQAQAAWLKKYFEETNQYYDPAGLPPDESKPLPDWLNANESGYPDWVDEDDGHAQDEYYHWLTDQQPDDLQYWAQHPDHAQKSFQYFLDPDTKGMLLHPSEFEKVEEGGPPVDVNAAIQNGTLYAEMQDAAGSEHILLKDFWTGKYPPEKLQSTVLTWLNGAKAGDKEYGGLDAAPKLQALYDKYFGNAGLAYNPDLFAEDVVGILEDNKSLWDYISPEKAKEALKNHLDKPETWNHSPEDLAQLQQVYNKWFGGGGSAPSGGTPKWKPTNPSLSLPSNMLKPDGSLKPELLAFVWGEYANALDFKHDPAGYVQDWLNKINGTHKEGGYSWSSGDWQVVGEEWEKLSQEQKQKFIDQGIPDELKAALQPAATSRPSKKPISDWAKKQWGFNADIEEPAFNAWFKHEHPDAFKGPDENGIQFAYDTEDLLQKWNALSSAEKAPFYDGGGIGSGPFDLPAAILNGDLYNDLTKAFGDLGEDVQLLKNSWTGGKTPDELKSILKGWIDSGPPLMDPKPGLLDALKAVYAKYFGSGAAGPAPFDAEAIIQGLIKADPDFWGDEHDDLAEHGPDWHKHNLEALIKQGEDGDFPPEEWAQYKALYEKYFGEGGTEEEEVAAPSIGKQLQKLINDYTGTDTVSDEVAEAYDNKSPADLQNVIVNIKDGYPSDLGEKVQQLFEQHLKGGTPAPLVHVDDLGEQMHAIDDTFAVETINAKTAEDQKKMLEYWLKDEGQKGKPKIKALLDKYFGSGAQPAQQIGPMGYDPAQALAEWKQIYPDAPPNAVNAFSNAKDAEDWAHKSFTDENWMSDDSETNEKVKAFYNKWFGKGVFIPDPSAAPASSLSDEQLTTLLQKADASYWWKGSGNLADFLAATPEGKKSIMKHWIDQGVHEDEAKIYQQIIDGLSGQAAPAGGTPAYDKDQVWAEYTKIYPNSKLQNNFATADSAQAWLMKQKSKTGISALNKKNLDALYEKYFGAGAPAAGSTSPAASPLSSSVYFKPTAEEIQGLGIAPDMAKDLANFADDDFKTSYEWVKGQMAAGSPVWKDPNNNWVKIVNYIDSKAPSTEPAFAPPPAPLPPFDPADFAATFKGIWEGSGWATNPHPAEESKAKLQSQLDDNIGKYGYSEKTNKGIALYEKYFGPFALSSTTKPKGPPPPPPLAPMTPDEAYAKLVSQADTGNFKTFQSPEFKQWFMNQPAKQISWAKNPDMAAIAYEEAMLPPPMPPMPFKSQELNPDDLTHWAANKPISEAGWKNFSTWWANTQVPPEQEQALYKAWFDKDVSPEKAGAWFQAMFEHHAEPSEGDLGLQAGSLPNWAESTWAFGKNAAQEWPVFQAWATKDPGLGSSTKIKQKLMVWNSLSPQEKAAIADNYLPANPVDSKAVIADLAKAYPDSDWKPWLTMGQGTLKEKLQTLAETGAYPGAIAAYNKWFGGNIPMPKPVPKGETAKPKVKPLKLVPKSHLPSYVTDGYGDFSGQSTPADQKLYTEFAHWMQSMGKDPASEDNFGGYSYPYKLYQTWSGLPPHVKAQITAMPVTPWKDEEGFTAWKDAQPTLLQEVAQIKPELADSYGWGTGASSAARKKLENLLTSEADPHQKQALLGLYQKWFGTGKTTLAEAWKKVAPGEKDWDKYLQTTPQETVAKLLKKKIKDEQDPEKFIQYCDMWSKYFPGPPGNKQLSSILGKNHPGGKALGKVELKRLWQWKKNGGDTSELPNQYYCDDADASPTVQAQKVSYAQDGHPKYFGWTPPGAVDSSYVPDPALLGASGATSSYSIPQLHKGQEYQEVLDSVNTFKPGFLTPHDINVLKSDGFQNWFERSTPQYKAEWKDHPGTLVTDYDEFINHGGTTYGPTIGTPTPGGPKVYDLSPFNMIPKPSDKDIRGKSFDKEFTHNKPREDSIKFPRNQDAQETLPLAPGDRWAPHYAPMPIYRLVRNKVLDLDATPTLSRRFDGLPPRQREHLLEQQRYRLRQIDRILNGPEAKRDYETDRKYFDKWCASHDITPDQKKDIENQIFAVQPILSDDAKWQHFVEWAKKNDVKPSAMYELASQVGVGNPGEGIPNATGNYDHPELAQLILDYMENGSGGGGAEGQGGIGLHWTRAKDLLYHPQDSGVGGEQAVQPGGLGYNNNGRQIPLYVWGLWGGQGEYSGGVDGSYEALNPSELEHTLRPGAQVFLRRMQIRDKSGDFHDLIDPGPISLLSQGRDEASPGRDSKDKESLAARLDHDLPNVKHDPEEWDYLVPGPEADAKFAKLFEENGLLIPGVGLKGEHPEYMKSKDPNHPHPEWDQELTPSQQVIKQNLLKAYRHFFVGRPDLPPPHHRFASMPARRVAAAEQLFDMATAWGVRDPEKYGLPMHHAVAGPRPRPKAVAYVAPERGIVPRKQHGIVTVHERYL